MKTNYANWSTHEGARFEFAFGAYGETKVVVFERPYHLEDALETAADWLKAHAPGHFIEPEYPKDLPKHPNDWTTENIQAVNEAEVDLIYTESGYLNSWEWSVNEFEDDRSPYHYSYGSGMSGCLFDNHGVAETEADAIEAVLFPFDNSCRPRELVLARCALQADGIYYFRHPAEAGAQYCEVTKEHEPLPLENDE